MQWFEKWFNQDYLKLYSERDEEEAEEHVDFIIRALGLTGRERILDLGCGMGRHALAFGRRGFSVVGVDVSQYLIDVAKQKLKEHPNTPLRFIVSDIIRLGDQGVFDVVISMFTSFGYYDEDGENARFFSVVRHNLQRGGRFFFDYLHPDEVKRNLVKEEEREVDHEPVRIERFIEGDRVIKTIRFPDREYQEKVKLYTREQIEDMLGDYRLEVVDCWNDYEGNPWKKEGDRQIFHCRAY